MYTTVVRSGPNVSRSLMFADWLGEIHVVLQYGLKGETCRCPLKSPNKTTQTGQRPYICN